MNLGVIVGFGSSSCRRRTTPLAVRRYWRVYWLILAVATPPRVGGEPSVPESGAEILNVAFTESMFSDVNMNDAKASIKAWTTALARDLDLEVRSETRVIDKREDVRAALLAGEIDVLATTVTEFLALEGEIRLDPIFIGIQDGLDYEEYVLLVHRDSDLHVIDDLKGHTIVLWDNPRTCLMEQWLESICDEPVFDDDATFFEPLTRTQKLSGVILPVFFRQLDACVVTKRGWEMMGELNPQISLQLRSVATSPQLVTIVLCLRADYTSKYRMKLLEVLRNMHDSAGGRQILTLFRGDALRQAPSSILDSARALLHEDDRADSRSGSGIDGGDAERATGSSAQRRLQ